MKRLLSLAAAMACPVLAFGETGPVPPPPTIIINYGSYQVQGQITPLQSPAPPAPSGAPVVAVNAAPASSVSAASASATAPENEPEGLSLGFTLGYLLPKDGPAAPTLGFSPRARFLRFLSLEGEGFAALSKTKDSAGTTYQPLAVSAQVVAQLTFRSALFELTPRFGAGYTVLNQGDWKYSGPHITLGAEVGLGMLKLSGEIRGGGGDMTAKPGAQEARLGFGTMVPDDDYYYPNYEYYPDYRVYNPTRSYAEGRLAADLQVSEVSRFGLSFTSNYAAQHMGIHFQFGL
jgi:hypothetical protein